MENARDSNLLTAFIHFYVLEITSKLTKFITNVLLDRINGEMQ